MAYWSRGKDGRVRVFEYVNGRIKAVPRKETKHLDTAESHQIDWWVTTHHPTNRPKTKSRSDIKLTALVDRWVQWRIRRGRDVRMLQRHRNLLLNWAIPFFLERTNDVHQWPSVSAKLLDSLDGRVSPESIRHINIALRQLWQWMQLERIIINGELLPLQQPIISKNNTPLPHSVQPKEVLEWVIANKDMEVGLMALLGYFLSLRPFEIFGLERGDFVAGTAATFLECAKAMNECGLYNRLAVKIQRQRNGKGEIKKCKTVASVAYVCCFDEKAAKEIVNRIQFIDGLLFKKHKPDWYMKAWSKSGMKPLSLKDLRRASLYWLGNEKMGTKPLQLQHHARHTRFETTQLYLRRPTEFTDTHPTLDLEA